MDRWLGLIRSVVIYHNPLRTRAWRRFYREVLEPGNVVFDVGAHVGTRARAMRAAGAKVVAVEPQDLFAGFLRRTLPQDITLIEAALGAAQRQARMAVSSRHPTVSSLQDSFVAQAEDAPGFDHVRWDRQQTVKMTTLDRLITEFGVPQYIKIDVEGYELDVLLGLTQPVEMISVEYLPGFPDLTRAVIDRLSQLGPYRFNPMAGERTAFLWSDWRDAEETTAWLEKLPAKAPSGDLFARLEIP
ncbi:FkbM family methyltransferase [Thalassococcus sp. S3]|uniref:FkbM family methyltransferase n=1 Tax=Thalassococcus sp. S3 TaxID=2017482 RepID=UPI0010247F07|nr:FkbM family methyltransferase [Thalassococcus sp. S3]QBF30540.1 methyltransferase FkbM [Thalassococcus sp. S3]